MKTKLLTFIAFVSLFASPAYAMTTPILIMNNISNPGSSVERDIGLASSGGIGGANGLSQLTPVPVAGILSKLTFSVPTTLTTGNYTIALLKNGSYTPINCTIFVGSNSCTDSVDRFFVQPGDAMSVRIITTADTEAAYYAGIAFDGTTAGESMLLGGAGTLPTAASTLYSPLGFLKTASTELSSEIVFPTSGTLDNMYIKLTNTPNGAGDSWIFTLDQNGTPTGLTCTITNTNTTCNDTNAAHAITVAQGDLLDISVTGVGTPRSAVSAGTGIRFRPTINGESVMTADNISPLTTTADRFLFTGGASSNQGTESLADAIAPVAFTWEKDVASFDTAPGAAKSRLQLARDNGSDTALSCLISGAVSTTCADNSDQVSVAAGDLIDWDSRPTNTPNASTNIRQSGVMFIQPTTFVTSSAFLSPSKFRVYGGFLQINGGKVTFH